MPTESSSGIPLEIPQSEFVSFLNISNNKRIFFSGRFGIGKTYFLLNFFKDHIEEYDVYHLFPVRYQISTNENIVEFLKYDLLVELFKKYPESFEVKSNGNNDDGWLNLFTAFLKERISINNVLQSTLSLGEGVLTVTPDPFFHILGKLGRPLRELLALDEKFQHFKREYLSGDKNVLARNLEDIGARVDSVSTNYVNHLLRNEVERLKGGKKSVLILDDFERIDPEHIFRILNVFSAHMDGDEENVFGFDRIIVVGDIRNIRSIFHHRYGDKTDFTGYFDKFFTVAPFHFNNRVAISERIPTLLQQTKCEDEKLSSAFRNNGWIYHFLEEFLTQAFKVEEMNLRQLYKPIRHAFPQTRNSNFTNSPFVDEAAQLVDTAIRLLIAVYEDHDEFLRVAKKIRDSISSVPDDKSWLYQHYASVILRYLTTAGAGTKFNWMGKYTVLAVQDPRNSSRVNFELDGNEKANARYFFDTLVAYIEGFKYIKTNRHDYVS